MRRLAVLLSIMLSAVILSGAGKPAPIRKVQFNTQEQAALDRVSAYLNSIRTLKSGFIQLGPQGQLDQGEFLLEKPGKMRFEYDPPNPILIVATDGEIYVKNARLNTVESYKLSDLPLDLILNDNIDLKNSISVTGIDIKDDALVVRARTTSNKQQGDIALVFSNPQIELRQWSVKDNQGGTTMVALRNPVAGVPVDESLFTVPVKSPASGKGG